MQRDDLLEEDRLGARDVLERLARHGLGQEADEVAGMAGLEGDADLAVGLEAADAGAVPGARIDHDKGAPRRIDRDALRRDDAHEGVIDRPLERAAVDDELGLVVEHVRRGLGEMLAILVAALAHHVEEQEAALRGVDHVFDRRSKGTRGRRNRRFGWLASAGGHGLTSSIGLWFRSPRALILIEGVRPVAGSGDLGLAVDNVSLTDVGSKTMPMPAAQLMCDGMHPRPT